MKAIVFAVVGALTLTTSATSATRSDNPNMSGMPMSGASTAKHGHAIGVITAIDAKAHTLTIRHNPIAGVGWPAMTMTFKAEPATLLKGLKVGQTIGFDCTVRGVSAAVTAVRPM